MTDDVMMMVARPLRYWFLACACRASSTSTQKNHNLCNDDAKTTTHLIVFKGNQLNKTQPFSSVKATLQN